MSLVVVLFAVAYAALVLAFSVVPLNMMLRKLMGSAAMPAIWRNSMLQLAERTAVALVACWLALAMSGRIRGRLTGRGMLALGAVMSGALAGALDVGLQRLWVGHLITAAHTSQLAGRTLSSGITAAVAIAVTLLMITRSTQLVASDS